MSRSLRPQRWWLGVLVLLNVLLRWPALDKELPPLLQFCDEEIYAGAGHEMYSNTGELGEVRNFYAGGLNYRLPVLTAKLFTAVTGRQINLRDFFRFGRGVTAIGLSAAAVVWIWLAAELLSASVVTALVCALVYTLSPMALGISRILYPDHYFVFFAAWVLYLTAKIGVTPGPRTRVLVAGGLALGLAASVKYYGLLLALPLGLAELVRLYPDSAWAGWSPRRIVQRGKSLLPLVLMILVCVATFAIVNYSMFSRLDQFEEDFFFNVKHYQAGQTYLESEHGFTLYALAEYATAFGLLGAALYVVGCCKLLRTHLAFALGVILLPLCTAMVLGRYRVFIPRNVIGSLPFVVLPAGLAIATGWQWLRTRNGSLVAALWLLLCCAEPVGKTLVGVVHDLQPDSRMTAAKWINQHLQPGSSLLAAQGCNYAVPANDQLFKMTKRHDLPLADDKGCYDYYVEDNWLNSGADLGGLNGSTYPWTYMLREPYYLNIHYGNPGGYPYPQLQTSHALWLERYQLVHTVGGFGPEVKIYQRKDRCS